MTDVLSKAIVSQWQKLLIIATAHTGNNLFTTPAIALIKRAFPQLELHVVALNRKSSGTFHNNPDIARLHITERPGRVARLARDFPFVLCLNTKSAFLLDKVGVPHHCVSPFVSSDNAPHYADQLLQQVGDLFGVTVTETDRAYRMAASTIPAHINERLQQAAGPVVAIHLGCGRTAIQGWKFFYRKRGVHQKIWPLESYIAVGLGLQKHFPDALILLTGTRNERFLTRQFAASVPNCLDMAGQTSTGELLSILSKVDVMLTHDCGVLHVAAAAQTPLVAMFGPTQSRLTGPYPLRDIHLLLHGEHMTDIRVDDVIAAMNTQLQALRATTQAAGLSGA